MKTYSFEKLIVWQKSCDFLDKVYDLLDTLPYKEKDSVNNQLRRAVLSIPNNIAEASGRISYKEKAHYTHIAYGSLMECLNLIIVSFRRKYMNEQQYLDFRNQIDPIALMLSKLNQEQKSHFKK